MKSNRPWCVLAFLASCGAAAAEPDCEVFADVTREALAVHRFEVAEAGWLPLPPASRYVLGEVHVVRQQIFERPTNTFHRVTNRYHSLTRERVIRSALPARSGEPVTAAVLDEAERILRTKPFLYDVRVIPWRACGERLDVFVVTRDVWTLNPTIDFRRSGGENELGLGLSDSNVLGTGKSLEFLYEDDIDRESWRVFYTDPNVWGSRWTLDLSVADSDDGGRHTFNLARPFYALDASWALGVAGNDFERDQGLWFLGDKVLEFPAETRSASFVAGFSEGRRSGFVNRWLFGVRYEDHEFGGLTLGASGAQPEDRTLSYPFVAFQRIEDRFDTRTNIDRVQRTEDLGLGTRLYAELGWSSDTFGASGDKLVGRLEYSWTSWLGAAHLLALGTTFRGYYDIDRNRSEDLWLSAFLDYNVNHGNRFGFFARAGFVYTRNLPFERQLLLGGDSGLRGYPNRFQAGDRRFLVTLEERFYSDVYPFEMFRLGAAVFVDVGRAWFERERPDWLPAVEEEDALDVLVDVGFGIRLESTRTRRDRVLHIDFAVPLTDGPGVSGLEISVSGKQSL